MFVQAGMSCKWTSDSQNFLLEHFNTIRHCPPHLYSYALLFSPPSSWLHEYYTAELSHDVRVVKGILAEWGACSHTVSLAYAPVTIAYQKDGIAVSLDPGAIAILDAITGSVMAVLNGHKDWVWSLAFSLDGALLVSGSDDWTVKLWDIQTGGVIKTFCGHTDVVFSVSISPDCTTIASGSSDHTIRLWHVQTGNCFCVIDEYNQPVKSVCFSPKNSQLLISACDDNTIQQWKTNGCKVGPTYEGGEVNFSLDGTHFVSWGGNGATVRNSDSGAVVAELQVSSNNIRCCCFSPNGKFVAGCVGCTIYVWDITGSDSHLVVTLFGHTSIVTTLTFSSSLTSPPYLISGSLDDTVKFWQIGTSLTDPVIANAVLTPLAPSPIASVSLQARDGLAISSDSAGVVKTWDILTGICKASFQTPVAAHLARAVQLIEGRLIVVWKEDTKIHIWDAEKGESIQVVDTPEPGCSYLSISGDGSKVFYLIKRSLHAWSLWTGEAVGQVELEDDAYLDPFCTDGSRVWVCFRSLPTQGWDFEIPGPPLILSPDSSPHKSHLIFHYWWRLAQPTIMDAVTGNVVFQLVGRYRKPTEIQWDGQYLVAGYKSGELLILDLNHVLLQ